MAQTTDRYIFNSDLLTSPAALERAAASYPDLPHVLDHPELRALFTAYDIPANLARKWSRRSGVCAILLGAIALLGASAEPLYHNCGALARILGLISAVAGILSVFIGLGGVLHTKLKQRWLHRRLMTERLRQFHFQTFVCHLPAIIASLKTPDSVQAYQDARRRWFSNFRLQYEDHLEAELTRILESSEETDVWLHPLPRLDDAMLNADLHDVFAAYQALRITPQLQYANYKLRTQGALFSASPRMQAG